MRNPCPARGVNAAHQCNPSMRVHRASTRSLQAAPLSHSFASPHQAEILRLFDEADWLCIREWLSAVPIPSGRLGSLGLCFCSHEEVQAGGAIWCSQPFQSSSLHETWHIPTHGKSSWTMSAWLHSTPEPGASPSSGTWRRVPQRGRTQCSFRLRCRSSALYCV
jgi:hypothetical protein